jgi:hypothetical protein
MKTSDRAGNAAACGANDSGDGDVVDAVRRGLMPTGASTLADDEASAVVRRALEMLNAVKHLLRSLSPSDVRATANRVYLGRVDDQHDVLWQVFSRRHEVLTEVFASQHAAFAQLARTFLDQRLRLHPDPGAARDDDTRKVQP